MSTPFARNTTGKPSADRYAIGRGAAKLSHLTAADAPDADGFFHLGNLQSVTASLSKQFLDHFSSLSGLRDRDARITIETTFDLRGVLEEVHEDAGRLFTAGAASAHANTPAIDGFTEITMVAAVKKGRCYPIANSSGDAAMGIATEDLTLEVLPDIDVITAEAGRTIAFTAATKTITLSTGSLITDGYRAGLKITIAGTMDNDGTFTLVTVNALTATVSEAVVDEAALSATATITPADTALVEDTDYECLEAEGEVFFLTTSTLVVDGDAIKATLTANASAEAMRKIEVDEAGEITAAMRFVGENPRDGSKFLLWVPKVTITGDGDLALLSEQDLIRVPLVFSAVKKDVNTPIATLYPLPAGGVT